MACAIKHVCGGGCRLDSLERHGDIHKPDATSCFFKRRIFEEAYRFLKQSYNLEDVRVRSYTALRNTYALVHAIFYFVSVVIGAKAKMNLIFKKICGKAKRFYEAATFYQYAVAEGIHRLLFGSRSGPGRPPPSARTGQGFLPFARPPG